MSSNHRGNTQKETRHNPKTSLSFSPSVVSNFGTTNSLQTPTNNCSHLRRHCSADAGNKGVSNRNNSKSKFTSRDVNVQREDERRQRYNPRRFDIYDRTEDTAGEPRLDFSDGWVRIICYRWWMLGILFFNCWERGSFYDTVNTCRWKLGRN